MVNISLINNVSSQLNPAQINKLDNKIPKIEIIHNTNLEHVKTTNGDNGAIGYVKSPVENFVNINNGGSLIASKINQLREASYRNNRSVSHNRLPRSKNEPKIFDDFNLRKELNMLEKLKPNTITIPISMSSSLSLSSNYSSGSSSPLSSFSNSYLLNRSENDNKQFSFKEFNFQNNEKKCACKNNEDCNFNEQTNSNTNKFTTEIYIKNKTAVRSKNV